MATNCDSDLDQASPLTPLLPELSRGGLDISLDGLTRDEVAKRVASEGALTGSDETA